MRLKYYCIIIAISYNNESHILGHRHQKSRLLRYVRRLQDPRVGHSHATTRLQKNQRRPFDPEIAPDP